MNDSLTIAVIQMASDVDFEANLETISRRLEPLAGRCDLALLPENALCLGCGASIRRAARTMPDLFDLLGGFCRRHGLAILFGGVPVADDGGIANAVLAFAPDGELLGRYDKTHLFRLDPGKPNGVDETRIYRPGPGPLAIEYQGWKIGLSICYDLRFPELYRAYAPCDLLVCPAAFTAATGRAHWEVLCRARAIENLCYLAAAGQCGRNPETGWEHHGDSMVVDPWGTIIGRIPDRREDAVVATLEKARIAECRNRLPALEHRRCRDTTFGAG